MTFALFLFLSMPALAAPEPPEILKNAPARSDADQITLYKKTSLRLHSDGKRRLRVTTVRKVFTDQSVRGFSDPRIRFWSDWQEVKINKAETWTPDGDLVKSEAHAVNRSLADPAADAPFFGALQEEVVTFLGVDRGAVLFLDYEIIDKEARMPWLDHSFTFGEAWPVLKEELQVRLPADKRWYRKLLRAGDLVKQGRTDHLAADVVYTWAAVKQPGWPAVKPPILPIRPRLLLSTRKDWTEALIPYNSLLLNRLNCETPAPDDLGLKRTSPSRLDLLKGLLKAVRLLHLWDTQAPARTPCPTWESAYATPMELGSLLYHFLPRGKPRPRLYLLSSEADAAEVPGLATFNRFFLEISGLWLDLRSGAFSASNPLTGNGCVYLEVPTGPKAGAPRSCDPVADQWSMGETIRYKLKGKTIQLTWRLQLRNLPGAWVKIAGATDLHKLFKGVIPRLLPGGKVLRVRVQQLGPKLVDLEVKAELVRKPGDPSLRVNLKSWLPLPGLPATWPLKTPGPWRFGRAGSFVQDIHIPKTLRLSGLPPERKLSSSSPLYRVSRADDRLSRSLHLRSILMAEKLYQAGRAAATAFQQDNARTLLLEEVAP